MKTKSISLSKVPQIIPIYGDTGYRGADSLEEAEQITFVSEIRKTPQGALLMHIKNEGKRTRAQTSFDIANGMNTGAADIIILGAVPFVCEIKRRHGTKAKTNQHQIEFLLASIDAGCFACYALGYEAALEAFRDWSHL